MNVDLIERTLGVLDRFLESVGTRGIPKLLDKYDQEIAKLLVQHANSISERIAAGGLNKYQLARFENLRADLLVELDKLSNGYRETLYKGLNAASKLAIDDSKRIAERGYLKLLDAQLNGSRIRTMGAFDRVNVNAVRASLEREWADGKKLSGRIWDLKNNAEKQILDVVRNGMVEGKSSSQVAEEVKGLLLPERAGITTMKPYGRNVPFDAMRLSRTEISQAFRDSKKEAFDSSPWVEALRWNRSNVRFECVECDDYETDDVDGLGPGLYKPESLPISHAQCCCYVSEETIGLSEFRSQLQDWIRGGENPGMDKWYEEVYQKVA